MDLQLGHSELRGRAVLSVTGEVDLATSARLQPVLWKVIDDHAGQTVFVDVRGVDSADHLGLGVLVGALARATRHHGDIELVCGPSPLLDVLLAARLDRAFVIHPTLVDAGATV